MEKQRFFWILDRTVLDQVQIPRFEWYELLLLAGALGFLAAYFLTVWYLDRRVTERYKAGQLLAELTGRLDGLELEEGEWQTIQRLAGTRSRTKALKFLADPVAFESSVHSAYEHGQGGSLEFVPGLREQLRYTTGNALAPLVSTRQLRVGDHIRLSTHGAGLPQHYYGEVEATGAAGFTVRLGGAGMPPQAWSGSPPALYVMRGQDLEHRFPFDPLPGTAAADRLQLRHALVSPEMSARQIRLPLLIGVTFGVRVPHARDVDALDPDLADTHAEHGILYDLSDAGFGLVTDRRIEPGRYVEMTVPLKRRDRFLNLMGRISESRALEPGRWMAHATIRGLNRRQRHQLHQVVIHEHNRRSKALAQVQHADRQAG